MNAAAFVLYLMFTGNLAAEIQCPDMLCVAGVYVTFNDDPTLQRLRIWRAEDYKQIGPGDQFVWPPIIDEHYQ